MKERERQRQRERPLFLEWPIKRLMDYSLHPPPVQQASEIDKSGNAATAT